MFHVEHFIKNMEEIVPEYWKNLSLENIIYINDEGFECEEQWKDISGYEGLYKVSDCGRVKNIISNKIVTQFLTKKGYCRLSIIDYHKRQKTYSVHRLVGQSFIPNNYNKPQINHIDGDKKVNTYSNLEWNTNGENGKHARRIGLCKQIAENASSAKLTNEQVLSILKSSKTQKKLMEEYGVSSCTISNIKTGRKWSFITGVKFTSKKMSEDKVLSIFNSNKSNKELKKQFNVTADAIYEIKIGKRWGRITNKIWVK